MSGEKKDSAPGLRGRNPERGINTIHRAHCYVGEQEIGMEDCSRLNRFFAAECGSNFIIGIFQNRA
jgi:hypothetical protein